MVKAKLTTSFRCSRGRGLTLIEVVAAIAILGTILVAVVLARSRLTRQLALVDLKTSAVAAADDLIAAWWASPAGFPIDREGVVPGDERLLWRTMVVRNDMMEALGAVVVRLEMRPASAAVALAMMNGEAGSAAAAKLAELEPLAVVEVVLPRPEPVKRKTEGSGR
jgi:prepilin-type N-terminal cleavage/methylation domain-containing protein